MGLVVLAIFWDLSGNKFVNQVGLAGCLFFMAVNLVFANMMGTILTF